MFGQDGGSEVVDDVRALEGFSLDHQPDFTRFAKLTNMPPEVRDLRRDDMGGRIDENRADAIKRAGHFVSPSFLSERRSASRHADIQFQFFIEPPTTPVGNDPGLRTTPAAEAPPEVTFGLPLRPCAQVPRRRVAAQDPVLVNAGTKHLGIVFVIIALVFPRAVTGGRAIIIIIIIFFFASARLPAQRWDRPQSQDGRGNPFQE
jgi:hypothetical protein